MKQFLKQHMPRLFLECARSLRSAYYRSRSPFSGIYQRFDDVPQIGAAFEDSEWTETAVQSSKWFIARNEAGFIPLAVDSENSLLPLLISVLAGADQKPVRVLDFGGGAGISYLAVKYAAPGIRNLEYTVIEHTALCDAGRRLFADDSTIKFINEIPASFDLLDVVIISASLQCVQDYFSVVAKLAALRPRYFLLARLPAGENPTYATAQINLQGKQHAHWLFNVHEVIKMLQDHDYELLFRNVAGEEVNQDKFPPKYRIERCCNLLFSYHKAAFIE